MEYKLIICGGTFDRLHKGHKAFLRFAFSKGRKVLIGLTSDEYVNRHKKDPTILSFINRKKQLEDFLEKEGLVKRAIIVKIDSRFDQTQIQETVHAALLVTTETEKAGKEINEERLHLELKPLPLVVFPLLKNGNDEKISSSSFRTLILPEAIRKMLHKPFGPIVQDIPNDIEIEKTITVGDETTKRFLTHNMVPKLSVVDFVVERKRKYSSFKQLGFLGNEKVYALTNPAGTIAQETWGTLEEIVSNFYESTNNILFVDGEEDLLVIPVILVFPVGFSVLYGQPGEGLVVLEITETLKQKVKNLLSEFTSLP